MNYHELVIKPLFPFLQQQLPGWLAAHHRAPAKIAPQPAPIGWNIAEVLLNWLYNVI